MELCPESLWENLCREDAACTFYQTPAWHRIAARHFQAQSAPLHFKFKDVSACLPLLKDRRWGRDRYFSPFGTYTALVCPRSLERGELESVTRALRGLALHLVSSPFTPNIITVGKPLVSKVQVIDLTSLDPENPMRDWDEGQRRRVRVASRNNITVRTATSAAEWERYYSLYRMSLKRWGKTATQIYPETLFQDIRSSLSEGSSMKLWVAEHEGEIGAGYLTFYHNRHVVPWHGAADEKFFQWGATQSLFLTLIQDAQRRGFSVFDLTGSGGLSGVEAFKSRFGTRTLEFTSSLNRPGLQGLLAGLRDSMRTKFNRRG
jgi:CelD/BcsL family acetyltransferase involved in cellulose biosynthesis